VLAQAHLLKPNVSAPLCATMPGEAGVSILAAQYTPKQSLSLYSTTLHEQKSGAIESILFQTLDASQSLLEFAKKDNIFTNFVEVNVCSIVQMRRYYPINPIHGHVVVRTKAHLLYL